MPDHAVVSDLFALRISRTVFSALSGTRLLACLIVAPQRGDDEPGILSYAISSFCPTSADGLQYRYRIRIPRANGWRKRSYRTSPSRAWRPLLSAVVDQHLLERVPGHLPRVGLPAIRWPSSAPRV